MESPRLEGGRINLDAPRYDQSTFLGRAKHFFTVTDPKNILRSAKELEDAKELLLKYRQKQEPAGTTDAQIWTAKKVYESAFHPDTGDKMFLIGRMSAQVPMNMSICGCMLTFYKSTSAVLFWQWINQSFNAVVNYTNRSGDSLITNKWVYILVDCLFCAPFIEYLYLLRNAPSHLHIGKMIRSEFCALIG